MADVAPAAAPAADEAQPEPSSSVEYESEKKMNISVDGTAFDLTALLNFSLLQDMLRKLAQQQREQATLIRGLRQDLEKANREGEAVAKRLKDEIDTKANEKALTALALETQRDKAAMEKRQEQLDSKMDHAFDKVDQRLEALQSKIYDCKVELESKAAQRSVDALELRVNEKASVLELADVKKELTQRVDSFEKTTEARFDRNEASTESNTKRIMSLEQRVISFASIEMVQEVERKMVEADAINMAETQAVEARRAAALAECRRELEMKHMKHEEDLTNHWTHIRDAEALIKTKANNEEMLRGFEQQKVDLHAVDQKHTAALKPVSEKLDKYMDFILEKNRDGSIVESSIEKRGNDESGYSYIKNIKTKRIIDGKVHIIEKKKNIMPSEYFKLLDYKDPMRRSLRVKRIVMIDFNFYYTIDYYPDIKG
jgi:hypothetical protein